MTKILKYVGNSVGITMEWVFVLFVVVAFAIRTSPFQTFIAKQLASYLSSELNTTISIDKVDIVFFDRASIEGFTLLDQQNDTLVCTPELMVAIEDFDIDENAFRLSEIKLNNGTVKIRKNNEGIMNYKFLVDYFSSDDPSTSPPLKLTISRINLESIIFEYDDLSAKPIDFGLDFNHLRFNNLSVLLSGFDLNEDKISLQIDKLVCQEKSGFKLNEFTSHVQIGPKGISLEKLFISLPASKVSAPHFRLSYNDWSSFDYFEDSVSFDAKFDASEVSFLDVSFWVPSLEGMNEKLKFKGDISDCVSKLKLNNLDVRLQKNTYLRGDFVLPDFRTEELSSFKANVSSAFVDFYELDKIQLPKGNAKFNFNEIKDKVGFLDLKDISCEGSTKRILLQAKHVNTANGKIALNDQIEILSSGKSYKISSNNEMSLDLTAINLGELAGDNNLGNLDGNLTFSETEIYEDGSFTVQNFKGNISNLQLQGYTCRNIRIDAPTINEKEFIGKVEILDPNLKLVLNGDAHYKGKQHYNFQLDITHADISKLGFVSDDSISLAAKLNVDVSGRDFENLTGSISSSMSRVTQGLSNLELPKFELKIKRDRGTDDFNFNSDIATASIKGKIDYESVASQFVEDISLVFPSLALSNKKAKRNKASDVEFDIKLGNAESIFDLFIPELTINNGTKLSGSYHSKTKDIKLNLSSSLIAYDNILFDSVSLKQDISNAGISGFCKVKKFAYDSIEFDQLMFDNLGKNGLLESRLTWNLKGKDNSELAWTTMVIDQNDLRFTIKPSFFSVENYRWEITEESQIALGSNNLSLDTLNLRRGKQNVMVFGCISNNDYDKLKVEVDNLDLFEISQLFQTETKIEGAFSGLTTISNPYKNLNVESDAVIDSLYLEGEEVGRIYLSPKWLASQDKIDLSGALMYKGSKTFNFGGNYSLPTEKLNLYLNFDKTDIRFANAFLDPEIVSDINGKLNGIVYVTGNITEPQLAGRLNLSGGSALIGLTGVRYKLNGAIGVKKDVFEINYIPVYDEEGNEARLTASINHTNFEKFNYDVQFDFESDLRGKNNYNRFMVLNTQYKDGEYYFGKAYGNGTLNISGSDDIVDISVNVETRKGTSINFPMYGAEEYEEDEDFITFVKKGGTQPIKEDLDVYSGVNVDMNFIVNNDAEMKLIFDNNTGDQIEARGFGELNMKIDPFYNVSLNGKYEISEGSKYNFAMGSFKQPFDIVPGSNLKWNGDLLDAELNIGTSITMKRVSLLELSPEITDKTLGSQDVICYLNLNDKLLHPAISFNIEAPKASETGKALVRKVTEDKDELNKQFFSLLLVKKFQPLKGSPTAGGSAAIDMLETQMNEILGKMSDKYKLNVDYGKDETLNETSIGFGMKTQFFDEKLIVSGTFGVGGLSSSTGSGIPIGDVNIEYLINERGTFRVNAFNESSNNATNANSANNTSGLYTQGIGISYHEDFHNWKDFMLFQYTLDLFRKEKKYWKKTESKPNKKVPVNPEKGKPKELIQEKKNSIK